MLEPFLVGVITMGSMTASVCFLKFYSRTRDSLFLAFGFGGSHEGSPWTYVIRLCAFLIILAAIIKKNYWTQD